MQCWWIWNCEEVEDRAEQVADAKRFKELVNENGELKKMLADEMLKNRVLEESLKKSGKRLR